MAEAVAREPTPPLLVDSIEDDALPLLAPPPQNALTPPATDESSKGRGSDVSELSELDMDDEEEDDEEEDIEPDHYYDNGKIPVFKPTMEQFASFKKFVKKIDKYGMRSGIIKIVPPKEWIDSLPKLDEAVKNIRIKNPITQEFGGAHGTYTQANIEKQRSYNLPQWKALTEESQHQPPARRGERRLNQEKTVRGVLAKPTGDNSPQDGRPRRGRPAKSALAKVETVDSEVVEEDSQEVEVLSTAVPTGSGTPVPTEAVGDETESKKRGRGRPAKSQAKKDPTAKAVKKPSTPRPKGSHAKSVAERRKYNQADTSKLVDEAAFKDFDYRFNFNNEFTKERCEELEDKYWKSLNFAPPMYGGDMPGSLFDDSTTSWNVAKLENLLDVLGQKIPGVNTTYLYLGMWKATFAWHLEDVDLYSINYIHFGAPKQWYSISQEDARRFENAMKSIWPNDAKSCSQFLRHKTYLISPDLLQKQFNIKVNRLVHYEGEFVITFPYGYHSGYNLGYNCAESVNFATESWLDYGRIAKKCDCEADSVWVDVAEIERKLRGEPTPEYEEYTDDEGELDGRVDHLPSPPASIKGKSKAAASKKRKRPNETAADARPVKKLKLRLRTNNYQPCVLCPNHIPSEPLLATDTGKQAHRCCAEYTPETYIVVEDGVEIVCNVASIDKARLELKCSFCRVKTGSCFQCSSRKCIRAYHATCAAAAGVQVELGPTAVYGQDGTEYVGEGWDFRCKFHRAKRPKATTSEMLESNSFIRRKATAVEAGDVVQAQYLGSDVFAGIVVVNRRGERMVIMEVLPEGTDRVEVEWRYLLFLDPLDSQLPKPSGDAKPLPEHMSGQFLPDRNAEFGPPQEGDLFTDVASENKWAEFSTGPNPRNREQVRVAFEKPNVLWHYLGKNSTDARAQFTHDPAIRKHNTASNYLDTVKPCLDAASAPKQANKAAAKPPVPNRHALNAISRQIAPQKDITALPRSYDYKGRVDFGHSAELTKSPALLQPLVRLAPLTYGTPAIRLTNNTPIQPRPLLQPQHSSSSTLVLPSGQVDGKPSIIDREHEERLQKYPYLHKSFCDRLIVGPDGVQPRAYCSPYGPAKALSEPYARFITQTNLPRMQGLPAPVAEPAVQSEPRLPRAFYQTPAQFQRQVDHQSAIPDYFRDPFEKVKDLAQFSRPVGDSSMPPPANP